jgi:hypothetical protein
MTNALPPTIDQWYARRDKGEVFHVVAVDERTGTVEIQSFDGDIEELDIEGWRELDIELAEPPENWTGPFDDIETDDLGDTENAMRPADWRAPLDPLRTEQELWRDARPADEREEEEEGHPAEPYVEDERPAKNKTD